MADFYGILLVVQLVFLIWCCIKTTKRKWIWQLSLQGLCTALPIGLYIYFGYLSAGVQPGPLGVPYIAESLASILAAVAYGVLLLIGALAAAIRWPREE